MAADSLAGLPESGQHQFQSFHAEDHRYARGNVVKPGPSPCPIIRIDTNQGVYGLGEVRDGASADLRPVSEEPHCRREPARTRQNFPQDQTIRRTCPPGQAECARSKWRSGTLRERSTTLPFTRMLGGGKFRDKIRVYADTTESKDPKIYAQRMKERKEVMGITWLKMDLGVEMVADTPGTVTGPSDINQWKQNQLPHPFAGHGSH